MNGAPGYYLCRFGAGVEIQTIESRESNDSIPSIFSILSTHSQVFGMT